MVANDFTDSLAVCFVKPHAYNSVGPSQGVEPQPRPFFSNNRPTPPTEQEEYSEEDKNVGISCNSEECHDIGQKTMVCLFFLLFYSSKKVD